MVAPSSGRFEGLGRGTRRPRTSATGVGENLRPPCTKDISGDIPTLIARLLSSNPNLGLPHRLVTKAEALIHIWNCMLTQEAKREELIKANGLPIIIGFLTSPNHEERYAAVGALHGLSLSDKYVWDIMAGQYINKVIQGCIGIMSGDHERSKLPATQLLQQIGSKPRLLPYIDQATLQLVEALSGDRSSGVGTKGTQGAAVVSLRLLLTSDKERPDVVECRRSRILRLGGLAPLVEQLHCGVPATVSEASELIRLLALAPEFRQCLLDCSCLPRLLSALHHCRPVDWAYLCGALWELTSDQTVAAAVAEADPVQGLLTVLRVASRDLQKEKKRVDYEYHQQTKQRRKKQQEKPDLKASLGLDLDTAVCNATGVLCHLSFIDAMKAEVVRCNGLPLLVSVGQLTDNPHTYENAIGVLWNIGMLPEYRSTMKAAGAPGFLFKATLER